MDNLDLELERVIIPPQGAKDHSQLQNLDYENSGHTGFASTEQLNATNEKVSTLEEQVQTNASAIQALSEGIDPEKIDGIKDLINYVEEHEVDVVSIQEGIEQNAKDIDTLEEKVTALEESGSSTPSGEPIVAMFSISSPNLSLKLKSQYGATFIDWDDGTIEDISQKTEYSHTYNSDGKYYVKIYGNIGAIAMSGFANLTNLRYIKLPPYVSDINQNAFKGCTALRSVEIGSDVTTISAYAFQGCSSLKSINLKDVLTIESFAFDGCSSLSNIELSDNLNKIGGASFRNCTSLQDLTIISNVTKPSLGASCFQGCTSLKVINVIGWRPTLESDTNHFPSSTQILVPSKYLEAYKQADVWSTYASQIDSEITTNEVYALVGNINTQLANIIEGGGV